MPVRACAWNSSTEARLTSPRHHVKLRYCFGFVFPIMKHDAQQELVVFLPEEMLCHSIELWGVTGHNDEGHSEGPSSRSRCMLSHERTLRCIRCFKTPNDYIIWTLGIVLDSWQLICASAYEGGIRLFKCACCLYTIRGLLIVCPKSQPRCIMLELTNLLVGQAALP